mmetsp:Transcript_1127/g.2212  ORF Transcript_1127/g.2212 Transcript_1127/m.2212 type:complete len:265 (+) Transcript_1127:189-983(+)
MTRGSPDGSCSVVLVVVRDMAGRSRLSVEADTHHPESTHQRQPQYTTHSEDDNDVRWCVKLVFVRIWHVWVESQNKPAQLGYLRRHRVRRLIQRRTPDHAPFVLGNVVEAEGAGDGVVAQTFNRVHPHLVHREVAIVKPKRQLDRGGEGVAVRRDVVEPSDGYERRATPPTPSAEHRRVSRELHHRYGEVVGGGARNNCFRRDRDGPATIERHHNSRFRFRSVHNLSDLCHGWQDGRLSAIVRNATGGRPQTSLHRRNRVEVGA